MEFNRPVLLFFFTHLWDEQHSPLRVPRVLTTHSLPKRRPDDSVSVVWPTDTPPRLGERTYTRRKRRGRHVAYRANNNDMSLSSSITRDVIRSVFSISCVRVYVPIIITDRAVCVHTHPAPVVVRSVKFLRNSEPYPPPRTNGKSTGKIPKTTTFHRLPDGRRSSAIVSRTYRPLRFRFYRALVRTPRGRSEK